MGKLLERKKQEYAEQKKELDAFIKRLKKKGFTLLDVDKALGKAGSPVSRHRYRRSSDPKDMQKKYDALRMLMKMSGKKNIADAYALCDRMSMFSDNIEATLHRFRQRVLTRASVTTHRTVKVAGRLLAKEMSSSQCDKVARAIEKLLKENIFATKDEIFEVATRALLPTKKKKTTKKK